MIVQCCCKLDLFSHAYAKNWKRFRNLNRFLVFLLYFFSFLDLNGVMGKFFGVLKRWYAFVKWNCSVPLKGIFLAGLTWHFILHFYLVSAANNLQFRHWRTFSQTCKWLTQKYIAVNYWGSGWGCSLFDSESSSKSVVCKDSSNSSLLGRNDSSSSGKWYLKCKYVTTKHEILSFSKKNAFHQMCQTCSFNFNKIIVKTKLSFWNLEMNKVKITLKKKKNWWASLKKIILQSQRCSGGWFLASALHFRLRSLNESMNEFLEEDYFKTVTVRNIPTALFWKDSWNLGVL